MFKTRIKPIKPRRLIAIGGTLLCAWSVGYLMQSSADEAMPKNSDLTAPPIETEILSLGKEPPLKISDIQLTSAISALEAPDHAPVTLPDTPVRLASVSAERHIIELPAEETAPTFACVHQVSAKPAAAAMVTLTIDAPCMANDRFSVHHNGMIFTDVTDENGTRELNIPALASDAVFIVSFSNGDGAVAQTTVTSLEYYDRVAVQWTGDSGIQIHALEFGAGYDEQGHVWAGAPRDSAVSALGKGGFITQLGATDLQDARRAEVYTFPTGTSTREGRIELSLEAEVTTLNCGRDVEAQSLQLSGAGEAKVQDVVLAVPDCDAVGDFLVLKNLLNDLKIAQN